MPSHWKAGRRAGLMCTLAIRLREVSTLAMSYRRRTFVFSLLVSSGGSSPPAWNDSCKTVINEPGLIMYKARPSVAVKQVAVALVMISWQAMTQPTSYQSIHLSAIALKVTMQSKAYRNTGPVRCRGRVWTAFSHWSPVHT